MPLVMITASNQAEFFARSDGSCWGISFIFSLYALKHDPGAAIAIMKQSKMGVGKNSERLMKEQDSIHDIAGPMYITDSTGTPISSLDNPSGFANQNLVIQLRHNKVKELALANQLKCIGTISSFFEGGVRRMIDRVLELARRAGRAAGMMDLQNPAGHAVVVFWDGTHIYLFDPNTGLERAGNPATASVEIATRFSDFEFSFTHVLLKN